MVTSSSPDANGVRRWVGPVVTGTAAAAVLLVAYGVAMAQAGGLLDDATLVAFGAKVDPLVADGAWWRLVTSVFLHVDGVHVAFNVAWLALFTAAATSLVGPARAAATALLAGIAGQLCSFAAAAGPSVGASGAVYGLAGALLVATWRHRVALAPDLRRRVLVALGAATAVLLVAPLGLAAVDHAAHLGGFVAGAALGALPERRATTVGLTLVALALAVAAIAAGAS